MVSPTDRFVSDIECCVNSYMIYNVYRSFSGTGLGQYTLLYVKIFFLLGCHIVNAKALMALYFTFSEIV